MHVGASALGRSNRCAKRFCGFRYSSTGTRRRIFATLDDLAVLGLEHREEAGLLARAARAGSCRARPCPSRAGTARGCAGSARRGTPSRARTFASRSRRSATVAVATYGISCAIAISGTFLPWPKALPGSSPTAGVVAVRAAGGVAPRALHAGVHVAPRCRSRCRARRRCARTCRTGSRSRCRWCRRRRPARCTRTSSRPFALQRRGDAGGDRGGVAEQRVDPRHLPRVSGYGVENTSRQPVALTAISWPSVARIAASIA